MIKKLLLLIGILVFLGCVSTDKGGKVGEVVDTTSGVLNSIKKIITFPLDLFTPSTTEAVTEEVAKESVPGGLPTWIGSTIGGLIAGFLAGRFRRKMPPAVKS